MVTLEVLKVHSFSPGGVSGTEICSESQKRAGSLSAAMTRRIASRTPCNYGYDQQRNISLRCRLTLPRFVPLVMELLEQKSLTSLMVPVACQSAPGGSSLEGNEIVTSVVYRLYAK